MEAVYAEDCQTDQELHKGSAGGVVDLMFLYTVCVGLHWLLAHMVTHYGQHVITSIFTPLLRLLPSTFLLPANPLPHNFCCLGDIAYPDIWINPCLTNQLSILLISHFFTSPICYSSPSLLIPWDVQLSSGPWGLWLSPPIGSLDIAAQLPAGVRGRGNTWLKVTSVGCNIWLWSSSWVYTLQFNQSVILSRQKKTVPSIKETTEREAILQMPGPFECLAFSGPLNWHLDWTHAGQKVRPVAPVNTFDGAKTYISMGGDWRDDLEVYGRVGKRMKKNPQNKQTNKQNPTSDCRKKRLHTELAWNTGTQYIDYFFFGRWNFLHGVS